MERIIYCHCAFARVLPPATKTAVLACLAQSDAPFDAVPDLCEMSARRDDRLAEFASGGPLTIVACHPRAVRGLFRSAGQSLPAEGARILDMRSDTADAITASLAELTK
jgi:hypothetical protein